MAEIRLNRRNMKIGDHIIITPRYFFKIFRKCGDGNYDICDEKGNCLRIPKDFILKANKLKKNKMKQMKEACLKVAKELAKANNTVTTLEIKNELRRDYPYFFWTQDTVSAYMAQFAGDGIFDYVDNGSFRIYSLVSQKQAAVTAGPVSKSLKTKRIPNAVTAKIAGTTPSQPIAIVAPAKKRGRPRKIGSTVQRAKVLALVEDPYFENVTIGGTLVTKADIRAQKKSPKGYLTSAKLNKVQYIGIGGTNYQVV